MHFLTPKSLIMRCLELADHGPKLTWKELNQQAPEVGVVRMMELADAHYPILAVDEQERAIIDEVIGDMIQDSESDYAEHYYVWKNGWIVLAALLIHANLKTDPFVPE